MRPSLPRPAGQALKRLVKLAGAWLPGTSTQRGQSNWRTRITALCWEQPAALLAALAAAGTGGAAELMIPLLLRDTFDHAADNSRVTASAALLVALAAAKFGLSYVCHTRSGTVALGAECRLRLRLLAALQRLDGPGQDRLRTGQAVSRSVNDLHQVQGLLLLVPSAAGAALVCVAGLVLMAALSPLLACVTAAILPLLTGVVAWTQPKLYAATMAAQQSAAELTQHISETVTGVRIVKGFGQESRMLAILERHCVRLFAQRMRVARISARLSPMLMMTPQLAQATVIACGGWLALRGSIGVGTFLAFSAYLVLLSGAIRIVAATIVAAQLAQAATDRIYQVLAAAPPVRDPVGAASLPAGPISVEFRGLTFGYAAKSPVLKDFNLSIAAGETVAVTGPAGSGKTALALLLPRLYHPSGGQVLLSGIDIATLPVAQVRSAVTVVFDEPWLLSDTVAANIALGRPGATLSEIRAAAEVAAADEFIRALPTGYHTVVGEHGLTLSGGQRQRIALARALLLDPQVLVLDDATSAVDVVTEAAIFAALARRGGRTTLILAHRESTLAHADRVVRLPSAAGSAVIPMLPQPPSSAASPDSVTVPPGLSRSAVLGFRPQLRLRDLARLAGWPLALVAALFAADTLIVLGFPALVRRTVDAGVLANSAPSLAVTAAAACALAAADFVVLAFTVICTARAGERVLFALRVRGYAHLQRLGLHYYEREKPGHIMTRMSTDVDAIATFVQTGLSDTVISAFMLVGVSVALLLTNVSLGLTALAALPPLLVATMVFQRVSGRAYDLSRDRIALVNSDFQENIAGLRASQAYQREGLARQRFARHADAYRAARMRAQRTMAIYFPLVILCSDIVLAVVMYRGAGAVARGAISSGTLIALVLYLEVLFNEIQQLTKVFDGYQQAQAGLRRTRELLALAAPCSAADGGRPARLDRDIRLDAVTFQYSKTAPVVLDHVALDIPAGSTLALVGTSGAGKSTIVKLLARFYEPTAGRITAGGQDVREVSDASYRAQLGLVPQEAHLFTGDVASNIAFGRPEATTGEVLAAVTAAGADDVLAQLPHGLRTPVEEGGQGLSAGQRQLIALARAELVDPDLLLLDEATAMLDPASEQTVLRASQLVAKKRTTVIVAHRLATAAQADLIAVVERGRVVETGTHRELLAVGGQYAALWTAQVPIAGSVSPGSSGIGGPVSAPA